MKKLIFILICFGISQSSFAQDHQEEIDTISNINEDKDYTQVWDSLFVGISPEVIGTGI